MRPPTTDETAVLDALVKVARPIILEEFRPDSCIASTRIAVDVLAYFGIPATPIPMTAIIFNPEAVALLQSGTTMEELRDVTAAIAKDTEGGPWTLGLGAGAGTGWSGHLVAGIAQAGLIVDLSIDQANRPHKNIHVEPYYTVVDDPDWWEGSQPVATFVTPAGAAVLLDRRPPDPLGYLTSPNWKRVTSGDATVFKQLTGRIIREIRAAL